MPPGVEVMAVRPRPKTLGLVGKAKRAVQNKVKEVSEDKDYVLDGKFVMPDEANQWAISDPSLITKFRSAIRRDRKVQLAEQPWIAKMRKGGSRMIHQKPELTFA